MSDAGQGSANTGKRCPPSWRELIADVRLGGITLVFGAGMSLPRGVPSWSQLVRWACKEIGFQPKGVDWLVDEAGEPDSLSLRIALEEVEHTLRSRAKSCANPVASARREFAGLLSKGLYCSLKSHNQDSLAALASVLREDQARPARRIVRVITLNADDLLETEANTGHDPDRDPVLWPISRAHHHPRRHEGAHGLPPISVYHVHGFIPRDNRRGAEDSLVFTDAQYWASMANPLSIANRAFTHALHDSHCIFIGLSMTDMNINRWLGLHAHDVETTKLSHFAWHDQEVRASIRSIQKSLRRHYWVRAERGNALLENHLLRRGVVSIRVADWQGDFRRLLEVAFHGG